jgi:ParB family chromosome partitioning protein
MAKFGINDILNAKTKAAGQQAQTEGYKEIYLSPYEVKAAQENTHQKLENIEELADSFLHVGQEQPTVLARVNGEYRIIDGHRRNAANILNLERGHKEYEKVLYRFMDMSEAMYELRLLAGNGYTQELTAYEKTRLVERTKAALIRAKEEDGLEIQGKMRDLVAAMLNESSTNVARMDVINNNATPEIKEQLKEGNIGITAAYEAAKLSADDQRAIAAAAGAGEDVRAKEIAQRVAEQVAAKAQEKADKAAESAEKAQIEADQAVADALDKQAQAEEEAENARQLKRYVDNMGKAMENASKAATAAVAAISKVSETDTEEQPQDSWGVLEWVRYTLCCLMEKAEDVSEDNLYKLQEILVESDGQVKGQMNIKDFPEALPESGAEHE